MSVCVCASQSVWSLSRLACAGHRLTGALGLISTCVKICPDSLPGPPAETLQVSHRRIGPSRKSNSHISSFDLFIWLAAFWSGRHGRARYFSRDCLLQQAWHGQEIGVLPSQSSAGARTGGRAFTLPLLNRERSFYPAVLLSLFPNAAQLACRAAVAYVITAPLWLVTFRWLDIFKCNRWLLESRKEMDVSPADGGRWH